MLKKRDGIITSIRKHQTRYLKKSHKFDIELPKNVEQALALDAKISNNTLWADAISKKMENVRVAFANLCDAIWYSISKWRISDKRPGLWKAAKWLMHQLLLHMQS